MQEGSILVGFSVEPYSGGRDLSEFADDITGKVGLCVGVMLRKKIAIYITISDMDSSELIEKSSNIF